MKNSIIKQVYLAAIDQFPKRCGCGRIYANEKEYLQRTEKKGFLGDEKYGYLLLRDCKCKSTITVDDEEKYTPKILKNINLISKQEGKPLKQTMNEIYALYEEWVTRHEKINTTRILVYDPLNSSETRELIIPHTKIVRSTSLEDALNSFQANPEWTRAILIKSSGDYSKDKLFLSSVKNHRDYHEDIAILGMIEQTVNSTDAPNFDCLTRKHLTKDQLTDFLINYLRNIVGVI